MAKKSISPWVWISIGLIVIMAGLGTWYGVSQLAVTPTSTTYDEYEILIESAFDTSSDATDDIEDALSFAWYKAKVSTFETDDEYEDLIWSDFSSAGTGDELDPDSDYVYICKIYDATTPDVVPTYVSTDSRIFEGKMRTLNLGPNTIRIANETEDVVISPSARDGGVGDFNQTNYEEWIIGWTTLDGAEATGEKTSDEGFIPYFDPSANAYQTLVIKVTLNTTASTSYLSLDEDYTNRETANGNDWYCEIDVELVGDLETKIKASSVLGSTFEMITVAIGYGNPDSVTLWDSYTS